MRADTNVIESSYSENAEDVVNKVKIYDEDDQYLGVVQDDELIGWLGTFQEIYTKEEDKQARTVAQGMLQGITRKMSVTSKGNTSCVSEKSVKIENLLTKLVDSFYIELDQHEWNGGQYNMILSIINLIDMLE